MKYLCLICAETVMEQMPDADAEQRYAEYREFTEAIRKSGHLVAVNRCCRPMPRPRCGYARARSRPLTGPTRRRRSSSVVITLSRPRI
jgi:hypothetical protein